MTSFNDLGMVDWMVASLESKGIVEPTPIQEAAIRLVLDGEDVVGIANTGSGKTLAFGIPLLQCVSAGDGLQVVVLAPTRELVVQIAEVLDGVGKPKGISIATVFGGVSYDPQIEAAASADVLVATPGRLLDHLQQGNIDISGIYSFVLDEADKMVEMGFIDDVQSILSYTPEDRQLILFGATIAGELDRFKHDFMYQPKVAKVEVHVDRDLLEQFYYNVRPHEKFSFLVHLLREDPVGQRSIIFCSSRATVDIVASNLRRQGFKTAVLHGKMAQNARLRMVKSFENGETEVLVASAVAARGIDIKGVTHIFNYDLSNDPQEYVHRIGRTARAGARGKAITLLTQRDHDAFNSIFRNYDMPIKQLPLGRFDRVAFSTDVQRNPDILDDRRSSPRGRVGGSDRRGPPRRSAPSRR